MVLLQHTGIGDLVWHIQYLKLVAQRSHGGRITLVAQPSTLARQLIGGEPWVQAIIDHDHRPRRGEKRRGRHAGLRGMRAMAAELRAGGFDRIILLSGRISRGLIAWLSGIPVRQGYGYRPLQRLFLNQGPYIAAHRGPTPPVYREATAFMIAHGYCSQPIVPRIDLPPHEIAAMRQRLAHLPRPLHAFAIGTSEAHKQWGAANFAALARALLEDGCGVMLCGGPGEAGLAAEIAAGIPPQHRHALEVVTDATVLGSAAALHLADTCIGNDTGMVNVAAAVGCPTFALIGARPPLDHDPARLRSVTAASLAAITVERVLSLLRAEQPPQSS
ncbi:MAG: glycosyltransferase family 9 protein [Burkholderiales bacterium]|nr:glycosyltransferase family 9 protein [Burkholderiales bacterium]